MNDRPSPRSVVLDQLHGVLWELMRRRLLLVTMRAYRRAHQQARKRFYRRRDMMVVASQYVNDAQYERWTRLTAEALELDDRITKLGSYLLFDDPANPGNLERR